MLRAEPNQDLTRDSRRHKLRPTGGLTGSPSREAQRARGRNPSAKSDRGHREASSWGQGSALTPLPKTSHIPLVRSPQPAIGTSHTRPHPVSVHNEYTPCTHSQHPSSRRAPASHTRTSPAASKHFILGCHRGGTNPLHTVVTLSCTRHEGADAHTPHTHGWHKQGTLPMPSNHEASTTPHSPAGPGLPPPPGPSGKAPAGKEAALPCPSPPDISPSTHLPGPFSPLPTSPIRCSAQSQGGVCSRASPGQTAMPGSPG